MVIGGKAVDNLISDIMKIGLIALYIDHQYMALKYSTKDQI